MPHYARDRIGLNTTSKMIY